MECIINKEETMWSLENVGSSIFLVIGWLVMCGDVYWTRYDRCNFQNIRMLKKWVVYFIAYILLAGGLIIF